jgi:hypothetical protein
VKPIAAIVETTASQHAAAVDQALQRVRDAVEHAEQADRRSQQAHEAVRMRRLELGRALAAARKDFPVSGKNAKAWTDFLSVRRLTLEQAQDAINYAGHIEGLTGGFENPPAKLPTREQAGLDRPRERDASPEQAAPPTLSLVPPPAPAAPEVEIDRDTWCTPRWITEAIGTFDLDPCSNERSTVSARTTMSLERGCDGLAHAEDVEPDWRVFVNPPYSDVPPWIAAYGHTRFVFLLKLDTSTRWFADLFARTQLILIPRKRIQFDPPPGVPPERAIAQQFPHALFYARAEDATPEIRALCWAWRVDH